MKRRIRTVLEVALILPLVLGLCAFPAAAHDFGPLVFCDAGALTNCTHHADPAAPGDTFSCTGEVGGVASCTNQVTGDYWPYCAYMGSQASSKNRDAYICGPQAEFSQQTAGEFWEQMDTAQSQGVYP